MLVCLLILLGVVVWFAYKHVNDAHKKQIINQVQQYESR